MKLTVYRTRYPLAKPYRLSFNTVEALDTVFVRLEGKGRQGLGEITPLPGYGHETPDSVLAELGGVFRALARGHSLERLAADLHPRAPFTASGLFCALDTWRLDEEEPFTRPLPGSLALAAFCPGDSEEEVRDNARSLAKSGCACLKMKVGRGDPEWETSLVRAACRAAQQELPGARVRIDANQRLSPSNALALCQALEDSPVEHLEQPFATDAWAEHASLAARTTIPVLLDESIYDLADISRASEIGMSGVKLKLCKHRGPEHTAALLRASLDKGLNVVLGNGVQTAVGNHLEARIAWLTGLDTPLEANGFLKIKGAPMPHGLTVRGCRLHDEGLGPIADILYGLDPVIEAPLDHEQTLQPTRPS